MVLASIAGGCCAAQMPQTAADGLAAESEAARTAGLTEEPQAPVKEALPEEPRPQGQQPLVAAVPATVSPDTTRPIAAIYSKYIPAGYAVRQIHGRDKVILGARDLYSLGNFGAMFASAGWEHLWNDAPNYGTDRGAFGQRLGAAAIRETSQGFLTDGVFAVKLHEDPRYFVLGSQFGFVHRAVYAATRPLITRSSSDGHAVPNFALLLGYACATALTNAYYPKSNRNFHDNIAGYGSSIGGAALGFAIDEFTSPIWEKVGFRRK